MATSNNQQGLGREGRITEGICGKPEVKDTPPPLGQPRRDSGVDAVETRPRDIPPALGQRRNSGFNTVFVNRNPPKELQAECPVCLLVLREPYQATCCGYSFCKTCIERVQAYNTPSCPTCNHENFTIFPNLGLQRALSDFEVWCPYKQDRGCEWVGELGELGRHLNETPDFGKQLKGCQFAEIECIHCGELFQRRLVEAHQNDECPRRPFSCDYCRDYGADYEDVVNKHWPVCPCVPVPCPNECGACHLVRQNLEQHVSNDCPLTVVNCDFHYANCEIKLPRQDMPAHLEQSLVAHISLLATTMSTKLAEKDQQIATLARENDSQKREIVQLKHIQEDNKAAMKQEITQLERNQDKSMALKREVAQLKQKQVDNEAKVARLKHNQEELQSYTGVLPIEFTMTDFEQKKKDGDTWFSPPFYTHPYGYKMCLGVDASGTGEGKGTHVTLFAYLMRGKFDGSLSWPFQGHVTVQLLNQLEDSHHSTRTCVMDRESIYRVTVGEIAGPTRGSYEFVSHAELARYDPAKNCQYLKDDRLCFRVPKVERVTPMLQHELQLLAIEPRVCVVPIEFTMTDFHQHKKDNDIWFSPPFYTRPQGYRMYIRVDVNGECDVNGTHISVFVHLMRGQYDNSLKWPFQGEITIHLLNQERDSDHHTEITLFNNETPGDSTGRVLHGVKGSGWGKRDFIPHSNLGYNPSKNCQYLKDDCLHFRVTKVKLLKHKQQD